MTVEPNGTTNSIRWRGVEVLAGVLYVVRAPHSWDTVTPTVTTEVQNRGDALVVRTQASYPIGDATFNRVQTLELRGSTVVWSSVGSSDVGFEVNRNGFVLLHHSRVPGDR